MKWYMKTLRMLDPLLVEHIMVSYKDGKIT